MLYGLGKDELSADAVTLTLNPHISTRAYTLAKQPGIEIETPVSF
jgi:hypothetical protein